MSEPSITAPSSVHPSAKVFKVTAVLEALSWLGLLIGMFFKWVLDTTEKGVQIMGPIHGTLFMFYVISTLWAASAHKWTGKQTVLGLVSSIPPLMTLWFEKHAERAGILSRSPRPTR